MSKTDGLIRCATYNMAGKLSQHPGDRKRKSPRPQNRYRSEIWGKSRKNAQLSLLRRMRQIEFGGNKKGAKPSSCPSISIFYRDIIIFFTSNEVCHSAQKILYIVRLCEILHKTLYLIVYIPVIDLLSDIIAIRLLGNTQFQMTIIVQKTSDG